MTAPDRSARSGDTGSSESPSVHPATIPAGIAGVTAGFFIGRLFGGILGLIIALVIAVVFMAVALRRPDRREPLLAFPGGFAIGLIGILIVAWFNF